MSHIYTKEYVLLAFAGVCLANNTGLRVGGLGELRDATPKTQHLVDSVRDDILGQLPLGYNREQPLKLTAIAYRAQIVGGYNYYVKIGTGWDRYIHVIIHEGFRGSTLLLGIQLKKVLSDPIEAFNLTNVRDDIIGQLPLGYDREQPLQLKSISYRKQMVGGYNYFIKIETGWDRYIHVIIHENLRGRTLLTGIELQKSLSDPIEAFDINVNFDTSFFSR
ncbi:uncharacterized protein LOC128161132 [Crassostrea angulata]|uniref:uncharacterized protein LOC128161132 n=1 Tax=Magallana angulata TaxID=2784310 RepID=UPI0022B1F4E2|nr:uncharacterized protein LOC128161132 [Crassostrea angulata]